MSNFKKIILSFILAFSIILSIPSPMVSALSSDAFSFVILSQYDANADIGDEIYLFAVTSSGKNPTWKSSDAKIASVNTYGIVTAKKAGTAVITAKIKNAEASCCITVSKTKVSISKTVASIERGETIKLTASTSNGSKVSWKCSRKSIATVDEYGNVTGMKPGQTIITASADGTSETCMLTVRQPEVKLNQSSAVLYRGESLKLMAEVSSKVTPSWKTNKKSVAIVDPTGTITAIKHGTALITATVDGVTQICEILVQKPEITLSADSLSLNEGDTATITALVSSHNSPAWSSSNPNIVTVNSYGDVTALEKGKAYIYATEDGTKVRCRVIVSE